MKARTCSRCETRVKVVDRKNGFIWCPGCDKVTSFDPDTRKILRPGGKQVLKIYHASNGAPWAQWS